MSKLIKIVLLLAILALAVGLIVRYSSRGEGDGSRPPEQVSKPREGVQPQEKYGFAPLDAGE